TGGGDMVERARSRVCEGMAVRSADGEKLGKVVACQPAAFVVEKGFLFPRDLVIPYERITSVNNGENRLSVARAELGEQGTARAAAETGTGRVAEEVKGAAQRMKEAVTGATGEARAGKEALGAFGTAGEIRVPVAEEEIVTGKRVEKVGEV